MACMEYYCHVWTGAPSNCLELLRYKNGYVELLVLNFLPLEPSAHPRNVASLCLFYRY